MPAALAASTSQPIGVSGFGRKGCNSGSSTNWVLFTGGVDPLRPFLFGDGLTLGGVPIAATSAARASLPVPVSGFRLALAALPGLWLGLRFRELERTLDWLLLLLRDLDLAAGRGGWGGVGPLPVPAGE